MEEDTTVNLLHGPDDSNQPLTETMSIQDVIEATVRETK